MSAKVVSMHVQRNKSLVVACKKKCTYYDLENLDSTAKNQLDPVDIIHNAGTASWELQALYKDYLTYAKPS